ncbi:MAG TPA: DUF6076 domain-containing protein [Clostridiaceae bacterium]|nr:DUF6076 domain-containing protein [Clostridiaceae bacterium]
MRNPNEYSIELNLYTKNNPVEITRFFSVVFDTSKVNLSAENKENLVNELYKKTKVKRKDDSFNEIFLSLIDKNVPPIPENLLFMRNIEKVDLDLILNYEYRKMALGDNLIEFLNLDFNNFDDFFKFFCTFFFIYLANIPQEQLSKIFKGFDKNIINIGTNKPIHIANKELLKQCAESFYEAEKDSLIKIQLLFRNFVDYIFNNNREIRLNKLSNAQRFYIFQNITKYLKEISKDYICNYSLNFSFTDEDFMNELFGEIKQGISNPLSNENFLINTITKNDPNGEKIVGNKYDFKTNNLFTYFYIILYHIVLNDIDYIKKCQVCGKYFFSDKNTTLYCNGEYAKGITCKEYGIKTSQKRKENEEPVYGKYRQIYAKKAMAVKRNPDIECYKTNYEKWKKEAKEFINDIKASKKTYDEFDEWLNTQK